MSTDQHDVPPTQLSFERPPDMTASNDPRVLYAKSYLAIRSAVGILAIGLPIALIIGESFFLEGSVRVRGSISAYYHTSMRDIFVGTLCVSGFLLCMYMFGQRGLAEFRYSLVAGVALIGVALVPTARPNLAQGAAACGVVPQPSGCAPLQQLLGEVPVATVHHICAFVFIGCLARIAWIFARREDELAGRHELARVLRGCAFAIMAAIGWIVVGGWLGIDIGPLTPLYVGEVVSVWAFGLSWLLKGGLAQRLLPSPTSH